VRETSLAGSSEYNFSRINANKNIPAIKKKFFGGVFGIFGGSCFGIGKRNIENFSPYCSSSGSSIESFVISGPSGPYGSHPHDWLWPSRPQEFRDNAANARAVIENTWLLISPPP
jgi:hypothetical protein